MKKFLLILILILLIITFISAGLFKKEKVCGDGTFYDNCSANKPYFCSEGFLVEKASVCGCPNISTKSEDSCISEYQNNSKEITLKYVLRGEENEISLVVYKGMVDYLASLPKFITYSGNEEPSRADFKLRNINEEKQRELLLPLLIKIQNLAKTKEDQARIAISIVQNMAFGVSEKNVSVENGLEINYSRYPYEVLYDMEGVCGEKSELLVFLLKEIGYGVVLFYHQAENHEAVGIKCPAEYGLWNTSYCFIEITGPSILTNNQNRYIEGIKLVSEPEVILISEGVSLEKRMYEYRDAKRLIKINNLIEEKGKLNMFRFIQLKKIKERYGLE